MKCARSYRELQMETILKFRIAIWWLEEYERIIVMRRQV